MKAFIATTFRTFLVVLFGAAFSTCVAIFAGPWLFDYREASKGVPLMYEGAVRIFVLTALSLFLLVWFLYILRRMTVGRLLPWLVTAAGSVLIFGVCMFDSQNALHVEDSWIRYPTAGFLFLTGALAILVARSYRLKPGAISNLHWMWWFLAFGFAFLACDELFEIHERLGAMVESRFHIGHQFTDFITLGYAVAAVLFMAYFLYTALQEYIVRYKLFLQLFLFAVLAFFISQLFDTFDLLAHKALLDLGVDLSASGYLFSDIWYTFWAPRHLLNSLEEVLENLAAILFCVGVLFLILERQRADIATKRLREFPRIAIWSGIAVVAGSLVLIFNTVSTYRISSPAFDVSATQVVTASDGLLHTDGLFFHPEWGLLIANEGKGNILLYDQGLTRALPDPKGLVTDTDAVTATEDAVYVSAPSLHRVFRYTDADGWRPFLGHASAKAEPEGLTSVGDMLYILDETHHKILSVNTQTRRSESMTLLDSRWDTPEGIAYHPDLDELLITDDTSGYIIAVTFGLPPRIFANPKQGLLNPEEITVGPNGHVFITDTGRREIVELGPDGEVLSRIRFHRMYGYLTGVAVVSEQGEINLYVVNSDGFGSKSFVPSAVWKVTLPGRYTE